MPPIAASTGTVIRWRSRSSPRSSSRFASRPTTRKKNVISPWLSQWRRSSAMPASPSRTESSVLHSDAYESDHGEFAQISAASVAVSSTAALPVWLPRNARTGAARLRAHAVRPLNAGAASVLNGLEARRAEALGADRRGLGAGGEDQRGRRLHEAVRAAHEARGPGGLGGRDHRGVDSPRVA